ncbi:MAG: hypothetical protein C7B43_04730 [Sulfobacillus benefaciens]|uniref:Uncharacterized protein n=1 Tax=Sulfobacillus benefaciens TaxID=453960 RepID=A0A2T2X8G1_9FIRM|nr:MAG: hypothetical protein C7B43_04730 [Sulfobacillus benefaciens]
MSKAAWPLEWTLLQDVFPQDSWTMPLAEEITEAERRYDVWLHWHDEGIYIARTDSTRNWCPLCATSMGEPINRSQVLPETRPFESWNEAKDRLIEWIRANAGTHWMISHQMSDMTGIDMQCRVIKNDASATLQRLFLMLQRDPPDGVKVCAHEQSELFWAVATENTQTPCPFCTMEMPKQSPASVVVDQNGRVVGFTDRVIRALEQQQDRASAETLYKAAKEGHQHPVTLENLEDIDCPDCRRVAEARLSQGPLSPSYPTDRLPF